MNVVLDARGRMPAALLMLLAVGCYSVIPLGVSLVGGGESPFLFNSGWRLGIALGFAGFLSMAYPGIFFRRSLWVCVLGEAMDWKLWAVVVAYFDIALFALSTRFVDVSVCTVLAEVSPIFLMLVMSFSYRGTGRYEGLGSGVILFVFLALAGFSLVVLSQSGSAGVFPFIDWSFSWEMAVGTLLALGSAVVASLNGFSFRWGTDLVRALELEEGPPELFGVVMTGFVANLVVVPLNLVLGFGLGESVPLGIFGLSVLGGALAYPVAGIAWRKANLMTRNLGVNAIGYARPVFSLVLLAPFSYIGVSRPGYLVAGAFLVVLANVCIQFESGIKLWFRTRLCR